MLLYGTECWPIKKVFEQRMEVTEMRMPRWMCGNTMMDRIRNQEFREKLGVAPLSAKMRENRLRRFGHVQRPTHDTPVRRIKCTIVEGKRSRGRPRRMWEEQIKSDMHELHLSKDLTSDRASFSLFEDFSRAEGLFDHTLLYGYELSSFFPP
ncbi:uncharacterized protein LOC130826962 [Amaranthus tricolor]|uniref:uncharacterized protein LOC130826962 n=1 Tax=Amaranthus tricolor TaxID=29722 RepID=UPI0025826D86|nr:uncharacterized protein LOC130826962 [Amaranthus tricolor]